MPYSNVPKDLQDKMERCVQDLRRKGRTGDSVYKICYASVVGHDVAHAAKRKLGAKGGK